MGSVKRRALRVGTAVLLAATSVVAILLATAPGAFAAKKVVLPPATRMDWVEARTVHFRVYSDGGSGLARSVARHLERLAETIERTTTGLKTDGDRPVRVFVFRNYESYEPYQAFDDDPVSIAAGYQQSGEDLNQIATFAADDGEWRRLVAHEYVHTVVSRSIGRLPTWLNEGLAEYYSTFQARGMIATIGRPVIDHILELRKRVLPGDVLFIDADLSSPLVGGRLRLLYYAESWGMVHMLAMDRGEPGRFGRLVSDIARGTDSQIAVGRIYGPQAPDSLTRALERYIKAEDLHLLEWTFDHPFEEVPAEWRNVGEAESLCLLGELLVDMGPKLAPLARAHLEAAWLADSSRALPAGLLARLAVESGDSAGVARWGDALERVGSQDPRSFAVLGGLLARQQLLAPRPKWPAPGASPDALRARELLKQMLDARPGEAEWLVPYAFTYFDEAGDVSEGIGALLQARESLPRRTEIGGALCVLQARAGNYSVAEHLIPEIPGGPTCESWRNFAGLMIAEATFAQLPALVSEGRGAEAESLVTRLARRIPEKNVVKACSQKLSELQAGAGSGQEKP